MISENDIVGRRCVIRGKHPHAGKAGKTVSIDQLATGGYGLKVELDSGESCYVFGPETCQFTDKD